MRPARHSGPGWRRGLVVASWLLVVFLNPAAGCGGGSSADPDGAAGCPNDLPTCPDPSAAPSYQTEVAPIIETSCLACHGPGGAEQGSHDLSIYDSLYPQRTDVLTQVYNCRMPPGGVAPLSADDRQTLLTWLVCGAPNN